MSETIEPVNLEALTGRYLAFRIADDEFVVESERVIEIVGQLPTTRVPGATSFMTGVANLRGRVLPIMDLRRRLKYPDPDENDSSCIIVLRFESGSVSLWAGMVVDSVEDMVDIAANQVRGLKHRTDNDYERSITRGMVSAGKSVRTIIDLNELFRMSRKAGLMESID